VIKSNKTIKSRKHYISFSFLALLLLFRGVTILFSKLFGPYILIFIHILFSYTIYTLFSLKSNIKSNKECVSVCF
jgi:hypothetical protein